MAGLPPMVNGDNITASLQLSFGSYMHTRAASNGDIYDMQNLSSDFYPLLSVRKKRKRYKSGIQKSNGLFAKDGIYYVSGTDFYANGKKVEGFVLEDSKKTFCALGDYLAILPDKKYYRFSEDEFGDIEKSVSLEGVTFKDGTIYGEEAKANTIYKAGAGFDTYFNVGDGVTISGCSIEDNNKTFVIREVTADTLIFYENTFNFDGATSLTGESITVSRNMPDMDFIFENENRLWGCKGDEIYACKPGDIFNWNVYDGISTDSYSVMVGSAGDFTAAISFMGYPMFFKDDHIYKVYGDKPSNFQVMSSASIGVSKGNQNSLAIAGEMLFYMSRAGLCVYSGGVPGNVSEAFGEDIYTEAVAGSDGVKYYVSMKNIYTSEYTLFVYDTRRGIWVKEDNTKALSFAWDGALYMLTADGNIDIVSISNEKITELADAEEKLEWFCEFADIYESTAYRSRSSAIYTKKGFGKLFIRLELEEGSSFTAHIMFDSSGEWEKMGEILPGKKRTCVLPIIPRRCDHYKLKLEGVGGFVVYSIARKYYQGSEY